MPTHTHSKGAWVDRPLVLIFLLTTLGLLWLLRLMHNTKTDLTAITNGQVGFRYYGKQVLVMYIFAATDPEFLNNLRLFIHEAVVEDSRCEYVIVVQQTKGLEKIKLPSLPRNARYVYHNNECYDWGTFGWLLQSGHVDIRKYKFFFFMNCSVRGPFLPAYVKSLIHWTEPFTRRLSDTVKFVGPTISCEGSPLNGDMRGKWRRNPHVQSYVVATDMVGLQVLIDDGKVFQCHNDRWNTIYHSELGSSAAILKAGYNLDCFMTRYQGVNWRDRRNWDCNQRYSCQGERFYDGITLDPLEVMFVKVKSFTLSQEVPSSRTAIKYEQWRKQLAISNLSFLSTNEYITQEAKFKTPRILEARARGNMCFDFDFYTKHNPELQVLTTHEALWKHYVYYGQFEERPHRFTCPMDYDRLAAFPKPGVDKRNVLVMLNNTTVNTTLLDSILVNATVAHENGATINKTS